MPITKVMKSWFNIFILLFFLIGTFSCNSNLGESTQVSTSSTVTTLAPHIGQWRACIDYDSDGDNTVDKSKLEILNFSSSALIQTTTYFDMLTCQISYQTHRIDSLFKYTKSGNTISLNLREYSFTPLSVAKTTSSNSIVWCSLNSWALNSPLSVLGQNCGGVTKIYNQATSTTLSVSGNNLTYNNYNYALESKPEFNESGLSVPDGTYIYVEGDDIAKMLVLQNKSYTFYHYDLSTKFYMIENGSYTSSNNVISFNITSTNPIYCSSGASQRKFRIGEDSLMINFFDLDFFFTGLKVNFNEQQFRTHYLGGGFAIGCF